MGGRGRHSLHGEGGGGGGGGGGLRPPSAAYERSAKTVSDPQHHT